MSAKVHVDMVQYCRAGHIYVGLVSTSILRKYIFKIHFFYSFFFKLEFHPHY